MSAYAMDFAIIKILKIQNLKPFQQFLAWAVINGLKQLLDVEALWRENFEEVGAIMTWELRRGRSHYDAKTLKGT